MSRPDPELRTADSVLSEVELWLQEKVQQGLASPDIMFAFAVRFGTPHFGSLRDAGS